MTGNDTADDDFYARLAPFRAFAEITDLGRYRALPAGWMVGVTDVVQSTEAIAQGRYKAVNTVGAAVLAAVSNALPGRPFPFVFGGDGAAFAVPGSQAEAARGALARTAAWAEDVLELELRAALMPVAAIREAGRDVRVARFAASPDVAYAMFAGGGLAWAEARVKEGAFAVARAAPGEHPDLGGLSCNFAAIAADRGVILSLIAVPGADETPFAALVGDVLALLDAGDTAGSGAGGSGADGSGGAGGSGGRPVRAGLAPTWLGSPYEPAIALATPGLKRFASAGWSGRLALQARSIVRRLVFAGGISVGGFDPRRYDRQLVENTDFRKFGDGLRMTVDCTPATADALEARLAAAERDGVCRYGTHRQTSANLTCFVPSPTQADHVHFVDGATGGYAAAAARLKGAGVS